MIGTAARRISWFGGLLFVAANGALAATEPAAPAQPPPEPAATTSQAAAKPSGTACRVLDPELQASYAGGCVAGLAQGEGLAQGAHGAWYRGTFSAGTKSGQGTKIYPNGDAYVGGWLKDARNGQGRYEYGKHSPWRGDVYQGGWHDDQRSGAGTYIFFPSGDRFDTNWVAGVPQSVATSTLTRRKQALAVLAPAIGHKGATVCSVTTQGSSPERIAHGAVTDVLGDRVQVRITSKDVLVHSADPTLNPRWEVLTDWLPCPAQSR
ncbi:MAG: hypothetical protein EPN34_13205 [Burkholderiaceae bacterium]|nr:MAG: hypothetical protein EPN34_13205 [Burkholderiaceae bacterium]